MPKINRPDLERIQVTLPPLHIQRRIAEILRTWDEAIEKAERLIAAKMSLFKNRREDLAWSRRWGNRSVPLRDVLTPSSVRVGPGRDLRVFSVTKDGLIPQDEHFNKRISNEDVSRHMLVEQGDFAFSGLNFWLGSVDVSMDPVPFCISPDYKVFKIGRDVLPGFFRHLVRTEHFRQILRSCAVERASVVRKNLDRESFLASEIPVPNRSRQEMVVGALSAAEEELNLLRQQRNALARQKRGLMQKLLTGEWSVDASKLRDAAE
jgi:type I restriction enzyme S subunit